jgi:cytoplasmic iron level regulating protein YaaA (DUF328/UPF0246 family)
MHFVRLLLPPSETKRDGTRAQPFRPDQLVAPQLSESRARVVAALSKFCAKPTPRVRAAIGTSVNQDAELHRNALLESAPTGRAYSIYDGVLFDAIQFSACSLTVQRRITEAVLVQSALFGVVGFGDSIPAYRCSANSVLPRIGRLGTYWRARLDGAMQELLGGELLIDLRSGTYSSMWSPQQENTIAVKVLQQQGGQRIAVSHFNKATKGRIVRILGEQTQPIRDFHDLAQTVARAGYDVDLVVTSAGAVLEVLNPDV